MSELDTSKLLVAEENLNSEVKLNTNNLHQTKNCDESITVNQDYEEVEILETDEFDEKLFNDEELLPEGWKTIIHYSGIRLFLNVETKVCSFTKPYFLGVNSLKNHEIPVDSIPCLNYKLKLQKCTDNKNECPTKLNHDQYRDYCKKLFKFKTIKFMRFSSWDKRREYIRMIKADRRHKEIPKIKDKSQLMSFPVQQPAVKNDCTTSNTKDQWIINLNGKSYVSILHEYIQRVLKTQPSYEFKELENARYPYLATVILDGMQYGIGIGSSKKQAKLDAARATLEILLPSVKNYIPINRRHAMNERQSSNSFTENMIFDELKIKDSRIPEFCAQAAESMPFDMLQVCVKRNFGEGVNVKCDMQSMQSGSDSDIFYRCTMSVKKHSATVICKNKREGRQKGAQALLKVLHPHISYFGSLLRLYSHQNYGNGCEKKLDDFGNQSPKRTGEINYDILRKLRIEMRKFQHKKEKK